MSRELTRRDFLMTSVGTVAGLSVLGPRSWVLSGGEAQAMLVSSLEIFWQGYPRAFFFLRQLENEALSGSLSYEEWEKMHLPLNGVLGKVLNEEREYSGTDNLLLLRRYKARNPGKLMLLYYNGRGRGATDDAARSFFAGHWLYYKGTKLTRPVGARASERVLRVADTSVFKLGRYVGCPPDDIAIAAVGSGGKPNWGRVEHVRLKAIYPETKTITVQRGAYGTRLLSFPKGAYVAAHVQTMSYPYNNENAPFWSYNFSTVGPRDAQGRTGWEALADYLVEKLGPGGALSAFDGITFDAFDFVAEGRPAEAIDANGNGKADGGVIDGVNVYGLGTLQFALDLRQRLPDKIILADCTFPERLQRSFGHLNGVESEGYPNLFDYSLDNLSKGANLFNFWNENSAPPSLNYVNFKYRQQSPPSDRNTFIEPNLSKDQSYRKMRLALASAVFTDSAFTYPPDWAPPQTLWRQGNAKVRIFDELWQGEEQKPNWLGMPQGPAVFLAGKTSDFLHGQGESWPQNFVERFRGDRVAFARVEGTTGTSMVIRSTRSNTNVAVLKRTIAFALPGIGVPGEDLFVSLRLSANSLKGYPASVARQVYVTATPDGAQRRESFTWANGDPFTATFYFSDIGPGPVDLGFRVEGDAPVRFVRLTAHSAADAAYREFENGTVFANNSTRTYTFDLGRLFPNASFRRIQGSANQDPSTNNGQPLGAMLTLGPKDALFVARSVE
jgi:hypothetical protein